MHKKTLRETKAPSVTLTLESLFSISDILDLNLDFACRGVAVSGVGVPVVQAKVVVTLNVGGVVKEHANPLRYPLVNAVVADLDGRDLVPWADKVLADLEVSSSEGVHLTSYQRYKVSGEWGISKQCVLPWKVFPALLRFTIQHSS